MARARSAYNSSRKRTEAITASKTIAAAETGEVYFINSNAAAIVITLPALQSGAYFKFIIGDELTTLDSKAITITSGALANGELVGSVLGILTGANPVLAAAATAKKTDEHFNLLINASASGQKLYAGSHIECWSDGSYWYVSGLLKTDNANVKGEFTG